MLYSYRIEQAIRAAAVLHKDQMRKGLAELPYVTHLYAVAMIVADYTDDEDTIIAALLHDTLEDTGYTQKELRDDFGSDVERLVLNVSEHIDGPSTKKKAWKERKEDYIAKLDKAGEHSLIISAADKIHNMRSTIEDYYDRRERFLKDFDGSPSDRVLMYQEISNVLNRRLQNDITHEFNHVFDEYKKFIANVQKNAQRV